MKTIRPIALLLGAVLLSSCYEKNAVQEIAGPVAGARVKFFHFGVNAPAVNFYGNDAKLTAISSATGTESTNGTAYGAVGSGGFYASVVPGAYTFTGRIAATVDKDLVIATIPGTIENGKNYSLYLSGFYNTTAKTIDGFVVEDAFPPEIDYTVAHVRFVHAISNANPVTLYATHTTTLVETAIGAETAYRGGGTFTAVPNGVYNLGARYAGVTTNAISRTAVSLVAGRVYTIGARGDITVVSTTATNRPFLDVTANR